MIRLKVTLQAIGMAALLLCAIGNALAGDWGNAVVALLCAILLTL
jgi:hypothetical protein